MFELQGSYYVHERICIRCLMQHVLRRKSIVDHTKFKPRTITKNSSECPAVGFSAVIGFLTYFIECSPCRYICRYGWLPVDWWNFTSSPGSWLSNISIDNRYSFLRSVPTFGRGYGEAPFKSSLSPRSHRQVNSGGTGHGYPVNTYSPVSILTSILPRSHSYKCAICVLVLTTHIAC